MVLGRLLTICSPLLITDYMTKIVVSAYIINLLILGNVFWQIFLITLT